MVTNGGVRTIIREETKDISEDFASIRRDLEDLTDKVDNTVGPPKEIDHAVERIASIEQHLGINLVGHGSLRPASKPITRSAPERHATVQCEKAGLEER